MYKKISDYGLIGDMYTTALVSCDGSIDYCSMPHIDSPTVFASLLDDEKGGFFKIQPQVGFNSTQKYIKDTNILSCSFKTEKGQAELIDFMPVQKKEMFEKNEFSIHRCVKALSGEIPFELKCCPRPNYASQIPDILNEGKAFFINTKSETFTLIIKADSYEVIDKNNGNITLKFSLKEGESAHFEFIYGKRATNEVGACSFKETHDFWIDWLHSCIAGKCNFLGEYTDMVNRSLLVLKLLTFEPSGAIAAAATTSLPESVGNRRNWDYRFSWIRDASFTLKALFSLGHITEADCFVRWLHQTYKKYGSRNLQIMYSIRGERKIDEKILKHLKGYRDSSPVRVGNDAFKQNQWDIYGEIMDTALRLSDYVGKIDNTLWPFFRNICNLAVKNWSRPDDGIWEVRNGPFHFVYSKVMCWVALDRGAKIARRYGFDAPLKMWQEEKEKIKKDVLDKGYDKELGSFVQHYGSKQLDASLLLLPLVGFLPFDDKRIVDTMNMCKENLFENGFLLRYKGNDGLEGAEGAFLLCNFWLIEHLIFSGKVDEAKDILSSTMKAANSLGLFSEEYDYKNNELLGNFPQAFSHIGFINAVSSLFNVEYKVVNIPERKAFSKRIAKYIPTKIVLNKATDKVTKVQEDIAGRLKIALNTLQGAFFDVEAGTVNYEAMKKSKSYGKYTGLAKRLNAFDLTTLKSDEQKKAFWINIYNILIIHGVIELDIENSVRELFNFFSRIGYSIGDMFFSADDIEHGILRANRPHPSSRLKRFSLFDKRKRFALKKLDPRIHFALVCASSSCPPIEFYSSEHIDEQLDIAAKSFILRGEGKINKEENKIYISQIFKWYQSDFGKSKKDAIKYLANLYGEDLRNYILENIDQLTIKYLPYNWNLNRMLK